MGKYALVLLALASLASLGAAAPRHVSGPGGFAPTPTGPPRESRHSTSSAEATLGNIDLDHTYSSNGDDLMPTRASHILPARDPRHLSGPGGYAPTPTGPPRESRYRSSTSAEPKTVTDIDPDYHTYSSSGSSAMPTETHGTVTYYPTNVTWVRPTTSGSYSTTPAFRSTTSESCSTTVTRDIHCTDLDCVEIKSAVPGVCTYFTDIYWKRTLSHMTVKPTATTTTTTTSGGDDRDGGHGTSTKSSTATMITDYMSPPPFLSKTSLASLDAPSTLVTSTTTGEAEVFALPCGKDSSCL